MKTTNSASIGILAVSLLSGAILSGSDKLSGNSTGEIQPKTVADALHAVLAADREVYASNVVNRLANEEKVIKATEHWKDDKSLPLPAQVFRMGSELVSEQGNTFSYALLSLWPINKKNEAKTDGEKIGLQFVVDHPEQNYYGEEELGDKRYFTAVYADKAVSEACSSCHNNHADSPRTDFKLNDVMGGIVIRIPIKN